MRAQVKRFKDIIAIRASDRIVGFHSKNLEIAELNENAWNALSLSDDHQSPNEALSELLQWNSEENSNVRQESNSVYVSSFVINISQLCNLKCTYCAAGGDGSFGEKGSVDVARAIKQVESFLLRVPQNGEFNIQFFGGEPLLHPEAIVEIAQAAKKIAQSMGISLRFGIVTNGTLLNEKNVGILKNLRAHVAISLDGPAAINDKIRPSVGGNGSTAKILAGLESLFQIKEELSGITVNSVFGDHNLEVVKAWEFLSALPFDELNFNLSVENESSQVNEKYIEGMIEVAALAWNKGGELELRRISVIKQFFHHLDEQVQRINHCAAGKSMILTDIKGRLFACPWLMNDKSESIGTENIIDDQKIAAYSDPLVAAHGCNSCWARFVCGGGCKFENKLKNGDKNAKAPDFCVRTRSLASLAIEYYAKARTI